MTNQEPSLQPSRSDIRSSIDRKILIRVRILFVLVVFKLYAAIMLVVRDDVHPGWILAGVVPGIIIGIIASRMHTISWDEEKKTVVSQMDLVGGLVLLGYLLYTFFGDELVEMGIHNAATAGLIVTSMAITVTILRMKLTFHNVEEVLRSAGMISNQ